MLAVGRDVERPQPPLIVEARELDGFPRREIEQREIQRLNALQVHQSRAVGQEAVAARADQHARQIDRTAVRSHPAELDLADDGPPGIDNQIAFRRPDRIDPLTLDEPGGCTGVDRNHEQRRTLRVAAARDDPRPIRRPVSGPLTGRPLDFDGRGQRSLAVPSADMIDTCRLPSV